MKIIDYKDTEPGSCLSRNTSRWRKPRVKGWVEYMYRRPKTLKKATPDEDKKSSKKISYVYRVPGKDLMVIAGYFE